MKKIGVVVPYWTNVSKDDLIFFVKLAEKLGYESMWFPEMWGRDAISIMSFIAANTNRIKIGTGIISIYSRSPSLIAQTVATLDEFSDGRIILGLGMSSVYINEFWHGIKFEKPLQRTREYVEIIRLALKGERVNYKGELFNLKGLKLLFTPVRENVPIYIASIGPKNIELTSDIADGWLPYLCSVDFINEKKNVINSKNRELTVSPFIPTLVSKDESVSIRIIKEFIAYYIGSMGDYYHRLISSFGFKQEADKVKEFWTKDRQSAINAVSDDLMNKVSLSGNTKSAKDLLNIFHDSVDVPVLMFPYKASKELIVHTMKELAPE